MNTVSAVYEQYLFSTYIKKKKAGFSYTDTIEGFPVGKHFMDGGKVPKGHNLEETTALTTTQCIR